MKHSHRLPLSGKLRTEKLKQLEEAFSKIHGETKQTPVRKIDYFKVKKNHPDYILISSTNFESAIVFLEYFDSTGCYCLKPRNSDSISKNNLSDFSSMACFGSNEKEEFDEIIKIINPLVEKHKKEYENL
mgnify:CR=1 FL=1